jgi:hypothetical protein
VLVKCATACIWLWMPIFCALSCQTSRSQFWTSFRNQRFVFSLQENSHLSEMPDKFCCKRYWIWQLNKVLNGMTDRWSCQGSLTCQCHGYFAEPSLQGMIFVAFINSCCAWRFSHVFFQVLNNTCNAAFMPTRTFDEMCKQLLMGAKRQPADVASQLEL